MANASGSRSAAGRRIDPAREPMHRSPSGLITQYLAWRETGTSDIFVGQQWLGTGQQVFAHTHEVEETLLFVSGRGVATMAGEDMAVGPGISLVVPPGVVHGFRNDGDDPLHVIVVFPGDHFARTDFVVPTHDQSSLAPDPATCVWPVPPPRSTRD